MYSYILPNVSAVRTMDSLLTTLTSLWITIILLANRNLQISVLLLTVLNHREELWNLPANWRTPWQRKAHTCDKVATSLECRDKILRIMIVIVWRGLVLVGTPSTTCGVVLDLKWKIKRISQSPWSRDHLLKTPSERHVTIPLSFFTLYFSAVSSLGGLLAYM